MCDAYMLKWDANSFLVKKELNFDMKSLGIEAAKKGPGTYFSSFQIISYSKRHYNFFF